MLIAAHSRSEDMILVTNNVREFERVPDLVVENWVEYRPCVYNPACFTHFYFGRKNCSEMHNKKPAVPHFQWYSRSDFLYHITRYFRLTLLPGALHKIKVQP